MYGLGGLLILSSRRLVARGESLIGGMVVSTSLQVAAAIRSLWLRTSLLLDSRSSEVRGAVKLQIVRAHPRERGELQLRGEVVPLPEWPRDSFSGLRLQWPGIRSLIT